MMNPAWPKRIDFSQAGVPLRDGRNGRISESTIARSFSAKHGSGRKCFASPSTLDPNLQQRTKKWTLKRLDKPRLYQWE
jgi:hypothetical protein